VQENKVSPKKEQKILFAWLKRIEKSFSPLAQPLTLPSKRVQLFWEQYTIKNMCFLYLMTFLQLPDTESSIKISFFSFCLNRA